MTDLEQEIRGRGYWWIVVHPVDYVADRSKIEDLEPVLRRARVQLRGWDFPHISDRDPIRARQKSIVGATDWMYYREIWRFYQSGQFSYILGIHEDWADRAQDRSFGARWGAPPDLASTGPLLGVGDTLFRITETFEFASKLAVTPSGGDAMHIKIEIHRLKDRILWVDSPHRLPMEQDYRADISAFRFADQFSSVELASRARDLAAEVARDVFLRFGWGPPLEMMKEEQGELRLSR